MSGAVGIVVVGRNEGERLERCLASLEGLGLRTVYVDSGSSDASVARARRRGLEVVELDPATPFTAARARNEGWRRLVELGGGTEFVQFVDGDCVLDAQWIPRALSAITADSTLAAVCGRRRELAPEASIYNRLCDLEWDTEPGYESDCGGDALMRVSALVDVGGFDPGLAAGEEPELCMRLRARGHRILRLEAEMTLHDAAILRFAQWWSRAVRTGYTAAQCGHILHTPLGRTRLRRVASSLVWALAVPICVTLGAAWALSRGHAASAVLPMALLVALALYAVPSVRAARSRLARGDRPADAWWYALFCMLGKAPQTQGALRFALDRLRGRRPALIEYKGPEAVEALAPRGGRP